MNSSLDKHRCRLPLPRVRFCWSNVMKCCSSFDQKQQFPTSMQDISTEKLLSLIKKGRLSPRGRICCDQSSKGEWPFNMHKVSHKSGLTSFGTAKQLKKHNFMISVSKYINIQFKRLDTWEKSIDTNSTYNGFD